MTECIRCGRPVPDQAYACPTETARAATQLAEIADLAGPARERAYGLSGSQSGSRASGVPGSRVPLDLAATARLDALANVLGTWARHVAEERQGALWVTAEDPIAEAAHWLAEHCEWMRHRPEVDEFLTDVDAAARVMRGLVRDGEPLKYLGPCGASLVAEFAEGSSDTERCEGDVLGRPGAGDARCRSCGAKHDQGERLAWISTEIRHHAVRAVQAAALTRVNVNTIRSWAFGRAERTAENGVVLQKAQEPKLHPSGQDEAGRPLYLVGDVMDVAEREREKRERRAAARADQTEGAAA